MKKWMFSMLLCLVLVLCVLPATANAEVVDSGTCGDYSNPEGVTWSLDSEGTLTISGTGDMKRYQMYSEAPWYHKYREQIKTVIINEGVTSIGGNAFDNCTALTDVTIANTVTKIGDGAFSGCTALTEISIPNGVTSIDSYAFDYCESLTSVTIPASVTKIGEVPFRLCKSLTTITVAADNPNYSSDAFGVLFNKDKTELIEVPKALQGSYAVPNTVTKIWGGTFGGAFDDCKLLTEVTIPEGTTVMGSFADCSSLVKITIPSTVTNIPFYSCFVGCKSLNNIIVAPDNAKYSSDGGCVLFNKEKTAILRASPAIAGEYTIPDTVTSISGAFAGCASLEKVRFSAGLTEIGDAAFNQCTKLTEIIVPEGVTSIGSGAFAGCASLEKVHFPAGLTEIGDSAFDHCTKLTEIIVPEGVTRIEDSAFSDCSALEHAVLPDSVTNVGYNLFKDCTALTDVNIPAGVEWPGRGMFENCTSLQSIVIPAGVIGFDNGAPLFTGCTNLEQICFLGDVPPSWGMWKKTTFRGLTADIYYPAGNETWTEEAMAAAENDNLTWIPVEMDGHTVAFGESKLQTCTEAGFTGKLYCTDCSQVLVEQEELPALGHTWERTWENSGESYVCKKCKTRLGSAEAPVIKSITFADTKVSAPGTIEVTAEVTKDHFVIGDIQVAFTCETTNKSIGCVLEDEYWVDSNTTEKYPDGLYHGYLRVDQYTDTSTYTLSHISVVDQNRKSITYWERENAEALKDVLPAGLGDIKIDVEGSDTPDNTPPVITNITFLNTMALTTGKIEFTAEASDDVSGAETVYVGFHAEKFAFSAPAHSSYWDSEKRDYVKYADGKLHGEIKGLSAGTYVFDGASVRDLAGNEVEYDVEDSDAEWPDAVKALKGLTITFVEEMPADHVHTWVDATCDLPKRCSVCGITEGEALGHTWVDATSTTPKICSVCGQTEGDPLQHTHTFDKTIAEDAYKATDATCTAKATYYKSCECGEKGTETFESGELLAHTWVDATCTAPKTCSVCKATEGEALSHTWVDATCQAPKTCSVCKTTEGEVVDHKWVRGEEKDGQVVDTCAFCAATQTHILPPDGMEVKLPEDQTQILDSVLTEEEKAEGKEAKVYLEVFDITETVSESDMALIQDALSEEQKVAICLDVTLNKQVGENEPAVIPELAEKIDITIQIPEQLQNAEETVTRTYSVVEIGEGSPVVVDGVYDDATGTLTFQTSRFGTYALVYSDTEQEEKPAAHYGDANGDGAVNAKDAMLVLQFYTKKITEDKLNLAASDVDGNGTVNAKDAMLILQKYTKKIEGFPIETK